MQRLYMDSSICALIVTRNRLSFLKRTIQSLLSQTCRIDKLIIVDNDSTDGTIEYLFQLDLPISSQVILKGNIGGAGGFHAGLQAFFSSGHEWCWLMDDDGWPSPNALEMLEPDKAGAPLWRNSIVINCDNIKELAFELPVDGVNTKSLDVVRAAKASIKVANPFNGTLIHRTLIDRVGLPIPELFIKGDETEYQRRAMHNGFEVETYPNSEFFHPAHREENIGEVPNSRVWLYYYKIRNIRAGTDKNGRLVFDHFSAYRLTKECLRDTVNAYRSGKINMLDSLYRGWVVLSGAFAAMLNIPFRWFVPK